MPPYSSSNFRPSLDPIAESCSLHLDKGKDANRRIAPQPDDAPENPRNCRFRHNNTTHETKPHATSVDLHRLMMADVPSPEVADQQHQAPVAPGAASLSSSQTQKTTDAKPAPAVETVVTDTAADPQQQQQPAEDHQPSDAPATPKLDPAGFFTLVSNASTNTTHHPTVRYIFADDDPDVLTSALAAQHAANQASSSSSSAAAAGTPTNNRAILLDVVPGEDGRWTVASAASLSADFAVTQASIERQEGEKEGGGMVLKIDGVEGEGAGVGGGADKAESLPSSNSAVAKSGREEYGPLLEDFERKMSVLRKVVKAGEGRAEKARETKGAGEEGKGDEQE
ncbi:hypothetical protein CGCA056_v009479 [Colletotrichum aenigma]|uniref:uncharacterized protein n=1 Tax=Colletotrichum aenigma TaxID=1215731 RepID=UPI001872CDBD|nr:uncharacterized protein CGCA056_v009479 [Colletotrichum aenigma]KAF5518883.1 hypothetical protein CGCA056_v009479 [Colletotrichum aenigma]